MMLQKYRHLQLHSSAILLALIVPGISVANTVAPDSVEILSTPDRADGGYGWALLPDSSKIWIDEDCRDDLSDAGVPVKVKPWSEISTYADGPSMSCEMIADKYVVDGGPAGCSALPDWAALKASLIAATASSKTNLVLNNEMWGTIVAADGTVCAVANSGSDNLGSQWLLSRVISAQKANTANALSLSMGQGPNSAFPGLALSTANLWAAVQPGGSLFGLQHSNPVNTEVAYRGAAVDFGSAGDPMVGGRIGGVNVFGGGLGLYNESGERIGGVGVSGDTSCRDHTVAWELRYELGLDNPPAGLSAAPLPDNIIFDIDADGNSPSGFGHPTCLDAVAEQTAAANLTPVGS